MKTKLIAALCLLLCVNGRGQTTVQDVFGRALNQRGITLVDWDGHMANPLLKFYLLPPTNAALPGSATLTANGGRLYFDTPSTVSSNGPAKTVSLTSATVAQPVRLSIFPDRDGLDEDYTLTIVFTAANSVKQTNTVPIHVKDLDLQRTNEFVVTENFDRDVSGFFTNDTRRTVVTQAADDWAYFFAGMNLDPVRAGTEQIFIWTNFFNGGYTFTNTNSYTGFLLYSYGLNIADHFASGQGSYPGLVQRSYGTALNLHRSGGFFPDIQGQGNVLGWLAQTNDASWLASGNTSGEPNDFYSIAHHSIGNAMIFDPSHPGFASAKAAGGFSGAAVTNYLGSRVLIDSQNNLSSSVDPESGQGAFGNEHNGSIPRKRWLITKLDLLMAQEVGYVLRTNAAFTPFAFSNALPAAFAPVPLTWSFSATGGIPVYAWDVTAGALPPGLTLDSFTGVMTGTPQSQGTFHFTIRARDYHEGSAGLTQSFTLNIVPAPVITQQPEDATVLRGNTAIFTVGVSGTPPFSYQWFHGDAILAGETGAVLTLQNVMMDQAGTYRVLVTTQDGSVTSANAVLAVNEPPPSPMDLFLAQFQTGLAGYWPLNEGAGHLLHDASGSNAPGYLLLDGGDGTKNGIYGPATSPWVADPYGHWAGVVLGFTNGAAASASAFGFLGAQLIPILTATNSMTMSVWHKPVIAPKIVDNLMGSRYLPSGGDIVGPGGREFFKMGTRHLEYQVNGSAPAGTPLAYPQPETSADDWILHTVVKEGTVLRYYRNGVQTVNVTLPASAFPTGNAQPIYIGSDGFNSAGELTDGSAVATTAGYYAEAAEWNRALSAGEISSLYQIGAAGHRLNNNLPPTIIQQPADVVVDQGQTATFTVTAIGTPAIQYQWYQGTNVLYGETNATLTLPNVAAKQAGSYVATAGNSNGQSVSSRPAQLTVIVPAPPAITQQPQPTQEVAWGSSASFSVSADGTPPFQYQWYFGSQAIPGATNNPLTLPAVTTNQSGLYSVIVSNRTGVTTLSGTGLLIVDLPPPPVITRQPVDVTLAAGATATFTVGASGIPPVQYQWYIGGSGLAGQTNALLILNNVTTNQSGIYYAVVNNPSGLAVATLGARLTVTNPLPPVITQQPADVTATRGGAAVFTVTASGTPPISYQWFQGAASLSGATSATLTFQNVAANQAGIYHVVVNGLYGIATSSNAVLVVNDPTAPPANDLFANRTIITGLSVSLTNSNANATKEPGEPNHAGVAGGRSLWWTWTAPQSGTVTIDTSGSTVDTVLAVYTGPTLATLTVVAANDDSPLGGTSSLAAFRAQAGVAYQIAVDAFGGQAGVVDLNLSLQPDRPVLRVAPSGQNVVLSWPTNAPGFSLQSADSVAATVWTPVALTPSVVGDSYTVKIPMTAATQFYRLASP